MYNRLTSVHKENPNLDYMIKFKEIIDQQLILSGVVVPKGKFCKWEDHNLGVQKYGECLVCYSREEQ